MLGKALFVSHPSEYRYIIIEDYPDDKYSPSCLILGFTTNQRPLHIQVSCLASDILTIITIYEPNDQEWIKFTRRR
jgi:hypothetical protein